jgi:hypothetical protein
MNGFGFKRTFSLTANFNPTAGASFGNYLKTEKEKEFGESVKNDDSKI